MTAMMLMTIMKQENIFLGTILMKIKSLFRDPRGGADPNEQPDSVRTPWTSNSGIRFPGFQTLSSFSSLSFSILLLLWN